MDSCILVSADKTSSVELSVVIIMAGAQIVSGGKEVKNRGARKVDIDIQTLYNQLLSIIGCRHGGPYVTRFTRI